MEGKGAESGDFESFSTVITIDRMIQSLYDRMVNTNHNIHHCYNSHKYLHKVIIILILFTKLMVIFVQLGVFIASLKLLTYQPLAALLLICAPLFYKMLSDHILQAKE